MRKKITMLLASLFACVGVMQAAPTDFPEMSTEGAIKWYTIKNVRKQKFATYAGDNETMTQQANASAASFFYFTASTTEGAVKIHNYAAGEKLCAAYNSWTADGIDWYLKAQTTGVSICTSADEWNAWNDARGEGQLVEYWSASDAGSSWEISLVTDFSAIIDVNAAKTAAIAEINNYAVETSIYPEATNAVAAVNAVEPASNGLKDLNDAVEAINAIVVNYRNAAYQALEDKFFTIQTLTTERSKGFMQMSTSNVVGTETAESPANIWQFVCNGNGTVNVFNPYTGKYLCEPQGSSSEVAVTTDKASAGAYVLNVNNSNPAVADAKVKFTSNGKSVHMAGGHTLVRWDNGGASEWQVVEITNFSSIIDLYKAATIATLDQWGLLSVVFDADLVSSAKEAIDDIVTTDYATFAAIDATLTNVTNAVANEKVFTFQATSTDNHRNGVWVAANTSTEKAIGAHEQDYNAIWSLRHAGGTSFYMYNVLNSVYMGAPGSNCPLTAEPVAAYSFEIVDAENNVVEMKCNGQTIHASNHNDDKLLDYDFDEAASRWYISSVDIVSDVHDVLTALDALQTSYDKNAFAADAEIGNALGQYQGNKEDAVAAINAGKAILDKTLANQIALNVADIEAATAAINATTLVINLPKAGKFYRFQGACDNAEYSNYYITGHTNDDGGRIALTKDADASTIYYFDGTNLVAYQSGLVVGLNDSNWTFASIGDNSKPASTIIFAGSPRQVGKYTIKSANRYFHYFYYNVNNTVQVNRCAEDTDKEHDWIITEVTELPVVVSAAGFATLYAPVALTIADGVTAYTAAVEGATLVLNEVEGTIPANTGVILEADPETYNFAVAADVDVIEGNALVGSFAKSVKNADAKVYTLQKPAENEVGFYLFKGYKDEADQEGTKTYINGFRAWIEVAEGEEAPAMFTLGRGGEDEDATGIDQLINNGEVVIYDLSGRRVEKMEKGIYIVNGKKVIR